MTGIDFEKFTMIDGLVKKKAVLHAVISMGVNGKGGAAFEIIGIFGTLTDAQRALAWVEKNTKFKNNYFSIKSGPMKKWKGNA